MAQSGDVADLERGRAAYADSDWRAAYDALARSEAHNALEPADVELLAIAAYMLAREDEWMRLLEQAHERHAESGDVRRAARCAFWIGMNLALAGMLGPATGWLRRAGRLLESEPECVEHGYMLIPAVFEHEARGDFQVAAATAGSAAQVGARFGDADLFALALHVQGEMLVRGGAVQQGLAVLDESMVAAMGGDLSPVVTGIVYCGVILTCESIFELRRAREWTNVLTRWCDAQRDLLAFTGRCLVHRAQILQLEGRWPDALEHAARAAERSVERANRGATARAHYLQGEVHRLRGEIGPAEAAYREVSRLGAEPQPGLALLLLQRGEVEAAAAGLRRTLASTDDRLRRAALLPTHVEILLAKGALDDARRACGELAEAYAACNSEMLRAMLASTRGAVALAAGELDESLATLRESVAAWQRLDAPYEAARTRTLLARAWQAVGDEDASTLELEAAYEAFEALGAAPDVAALSALVPVRPAGVHGLSGRELEVLRLVARGMSNKEIARLLVISEHTVARHVQNILRKLHVRSRAAAGAFAFAHGLL